MVSDSTRQNMKRVYFYNKTGEKLSGILHTPEKSTKSAVIICHGYASSKDNKEVWAEAIWKKGIAVLRFDFSGHGESEGLFEEMTITKIAGDLMSAVDFLESLGYQKIGATGHSLGGLACLSAASNDKRIRAIAPVSAPTDFRHFFDGLEKRLGMDFADRWKKSKSISFYGKNMNYGFYEDVVKYNDEKMLEKIICPVLLIHGDKDILVDSNQSVNAFNLLKEPKSLEIIRNAGHMFEGRQYQEMVDLTAEWLEKWLE